MLLLGAHCRGCRGILLLPQREWRRKKQLYACDHCYTSQLIYFVPRCNQHHWLGSKLFSFPLVNRVPRTQGTRAAAPNPTGSGCPHQLSPGLVMLHRIPPPAGQTPARLKPPPCSQILHLRIPSTSQLTRESRHQLGFCSLAADTKEHSNQRTDSGDFLLLKKKNKYILFFSKYVFLYVKCFGSVID